MNDAKVITSSTDDNSLAEYSMSEDELWPEISFSEFADRTATTSPLTLEEALDTFSHASENPVFLQKCLYDVRSDEFWQVKIHHLSFAKTLWILKTPTTTRRFSRDYSDQIEHAFLSQSSSFSLSPKITVCFDTMSLLFAPKKDDEEDDEDYVDHNSDSDDSKSDTSAQECATLARFSRTWKSVILREQLTDEVFFAIRQRASGFNAAIFRDKFNESGEIIRIHAPEVVSDALIAMVRTRNPFIAVNHVQGHFLFQAQHLVNENGH